MTIQANIFSTAHSLSASSSGFDNADLIDFGFTATELHLVNTCGDRLWYRLDGGGTPSTQFGFLRGCSELRISNIRTCGLGLKATSTSTAANASPLVGITSWGP